MYLSLWDSFGNRRSFSGVSGLGAPALAASLSLPVFVLGAGRIVFGRIVVDLMVFRQIVVFASFDSRPGGSSNGTLRDGLAIDDYACGFGLKRGHSQVG